MELEFTDRAQRTKDAYSFNFRPNQEVSWKAGQYMDFEIAHADPDERGTHHWFTISSAPHEKLITVTTRIAPQGSSFKRALFNLQPGARIASGLPRGDFVIEELDARYVFIAGGIGITPFRSILSQLRFEGQNPVIDLLYLNKDDDIVYKDELLRLSREMSNFKIHFFIDQSLDDETLKSYSGARFYLSGPRAMVENYQHLLEAHQPAETIKTDYFPGY